MHWFVDGNNVMGAGADGWWNDPVAAAERLTQAIAEWVRGHDDPVTVVFDGRPDRRLSDLAGGTLAVEFATRTGRDAADDRIVDLVEEASTRPSPTLRVVTSDKGLVARLPPGVEVEGAGAFRTRLGLADSGPTSRRSVRTAALTDRAPADGTSGAPTESIQPRVAAGERRQASGRSAASSSSAADPRVELARRHRLGQLRDRGRWRSPPGPARSGGRRPAG